MDTLEFKNTVSEGKKKITGFFSVQWTEKRVHELGGGSIEIDQHDEQREKRRKKERKKKREIPGSMECYQNTSHSCYWGTGERLVW